MKIITRDELAKMPNGTLYGRYLDGYLADVNVICGNYKKHIGFNGVLPLEPFKHYYKDDNWSIVTNWSTIDVCDFEYDENEKFAVFSKTEIRAMITVLQYALADCNFDITKFEETYYDGDNEFSEKEIYDDLER